MVDLPKEEDTWDELRSLAASDGILRGDETKLDILLENSVKNELKLKRRTCLNRFEEHDKKLKVMRGTTRVINPKREARKKKKVPKGNQFVHAVPQK